MRLRDAALWALGASSAKAANGSDDDGRGVNAEPTVVFINGDFFGDDSARNAIFNRQEEQYHSFNFQSKTEIIVNNVWVRTLRGDTPIAHGSREGLSGQTASPGSSGGIVEDQYNPIQLQQKTATTGQMSFDLYNFNPPRNNELLYLEVQWNHLRLTGGGSSYSRAFAIAPRSASSADVENIVRQFAGLLSVNNETAARPELQSSGSAVGPSSPAPGSTTTDGDIAPTVTTGTSSPPMASQASAVGSGGLSAGAIAGIAVACGVLGIAIVGVVAFFLIRRNRRAARGAPYSNGRAHRTADLMAEKEATAGVTESPHSPYSDDGHSGGTAAMFGGQQLQHQQHHYQQQPPHPAAPGSDVYTPYSDGRHTPGMRESMALESEAGTEHMSVAASRQGDRGGASTQMSGRYAHLMEEGMSPEERARIEEEERHLDAAIEQAGQPRQ